MNFTANQILVAQWGYDQTNTTFYKIVSTTAKTVTLVELASNKATTDGFTGAICPDMETEIGPKLRRQIKGDKVKIENFRYAKLWDGNPKTYTAYA